MKKQNIEVEGGELLIQSKEGHYAVIPAKHRQEVMDMVKDGCDDCINNYIQSLPKDSDYAEDGSLIPGEDDSHNAMTQPTMDLDTKGWGSKSSYKTRRRKKREAKEIIDESNRRERMFMNTPTYRRLLEAEYEIDANASREMKNKKLEQVRNFNYKHAQNNDGAEGFYTGHDNTITFNDIPNSRIKGTLSHERSHGLEEYDGSGEPVPGSGFRRKLADIYKKKGIYDEDLKIGDASIPEYINTKIEYDDGKHLERKLPTIGQYPEGSANPLEYYIITPTGNVNIGKKEDLHNWFDKNYPGLIKDNENWSKELRVLRLSAREGAGQFEHTKKYQHQATNQMLKDGIDEKDKDYFFKLLNKSSDERYDDYVNYFRDNEYLFPIQHANKDNDDYYQTKKIPNPEYDPFVKSLDEVLPNYYSTKNFYDIHNGNLIDSGLGRKKDFYYYAPTEVKARLKAIRDNAVENGFRIGNDIIPYLQQIEDSGVNDQYLDLKQKVGLTDEEINELMNYFAQLDNENNTNNLI